MSWCVFCIFTFLKRNAQSHTFVAKEFVLLLRADVPGCGAGGDDAPGCAGLILLISAAVL